MRIAILLLFSSLLSFGAVTSPNQKAEQLKTELQRAIEYIQKVGEKKAFAELSKPEENEFNKGDSYVFVVSYDGTVLAHPTLKVGDNYSNLTDEYGTPIVQIQIEIAKNGGGLMGFYWKKPHENVIKFKTNYIMPVPGKNYYVGTGFYD